MITNETHHSRTARPVGVARNQGCYRCGHCQEVVIPTMAQIELAENAPSADPAIKCPHCHKYAVHWQQPLSSRYRHHQPSVSAERAHELFAGIFRMLAQN